MKQKTIYVAVNEGGQPMEAFFYRSPAEAKAKELNGHIYIVPLTKGMGALSEDEKMQKEMEEDVARRVKSVIKTQFNLEQEIKCKDDLYIDYGCDSLDLAELIIAMEKEFDIRVDDGDDIMRLGGCVKTVQDVVDNVIVLIERK